MKTSICQPLRMQRATWSIGLCALALILLLASEVPAQTQTNVTTPVPPGGTIGKIPKWTATTALGESVITESSGNVGIGAANPGSLLHIAAKTPVLKIQTTATLGVDAQSAFQTKIQFAYDPTAEDRGEIWYDNYNAQMYIDQVYPAAAANLYFRRNVGVLGAPNMQATMTLSGSGNVGIGTTTPNRLLEIFGNSNPGVRITNSGISGNGAFMLYTRNTTGALSGRQFSIWDENASSDRVVLDSLGNLGIGTTAPTTKLHVVGDGHFTGSLTVDGNIAAKYQDVAEWVPARHAIAAGTVVILDPEHSYHVLASSRSYDTRVAGVVSANPGVILGEGGEGKVMVGTTGRVRVKVDATSAPIRVGDLLVTSDKEGIAMRSQPLDLGGTPIHRPGTLIGKALEPLEKGVGEILVLLSLQ